MRKLQYLYCIMDIRINISIEVGGCLVKKILTLPLKAAECWALRRYSVRRSHSFCVPCVRSEELLDECYCLDDFVLRAKPHRNHIARLRVFRNEREAFARRDPPRAKRLDENERLGCAPNDVDPLMDAFCPLVAGIDKSSKVKREHVRINPVTLLLAQLDGLDSMRGNASQETGSVYPVNQTVETLDRISLPRTVNVLGMDYADISSPFDQKPEFLLMALQGRSLVNPRAADKTNRLRIPFPHPRQDRDDALVRTGLDGVDSKAHAPLYRPLNHLVVETRRVLGSPGLTEMGMGVERVGPADNLAERHITDGHLLHVVVLSSTQNDN